MLTPHRRRKSPRIAFAHAGAAGRVACPDRVAHKGCRGPRRVWGHSGLRQSYDDCDGIIVRTLETVRVR